MGQGIHAALLNRRTRNVGCWIDLDASDKRHISLAFTYAAVAGAKLHLLSAMPNVDDGTLISTLYSNSPLYADGIARDIQDLVGWVPAKPEVHVRPGPSRRVIPQIARDLELDLLFVGKKNALRSGLVRRSVHPAVDGCGCPVICSDGKAHAWHLKRGRAFEFQTASKAA